MWPSVEGVVGVGQIELKQGRTRISSFAKKDALSIGGGDNGKFHQESSYWQKNPQTSREARLGNNVIDLYALPRLQLHGRESTISIALPAQWMTYGMQTRKKR